MYKRTIKIKNIYFRRLATVFIALIFLSSFFIGVKSEKIVNNNFNDNNTINILDITNIIVSPDKQIVVPESYLM
jgi:hypothetical protein